MTKMRKGQSKSFNNWLRVRIVAQGLTVGAIVLGSWTLGSRASQTHAEESVAAREEKLAVEKDAFMERLKGAEETQMVEDLLKAGKAAEPVPAVQVGKAVPSGQAQKGSSWWSWKAWTGKGSS